MVQKRKGSKGSIVWDKSASHDLVSIAIDCGYKVISIPSQDQAQSDSYIATKYAKGRFPICVGDKTAYKEMYFSEGATGFIVLESYRREDLGQLQKIFKDFLNSHTTSSFRGKMWTVTLKGVKNKRLTET